MASRSSHTPLALLALVLSCGGGDAARDAAAVPGSTAGGGTGGAGSGGASGPGPSGQAGVAGGAGAATEQPLAGTWVLRLAGAPAELRVADGAPTGELAVEGATVPMIDVSTPGAAFRTWRALDGSRWLRLRRGGPVVAGRAAAGEGGAEPPLAAFAAHVTGWNRAALHARPSRVFRVTMGADTVVLRLDARGPLGRWKRVSGPAGEGDEVDLSGIAWAGDAVAFDVPGLGPCEATVGETAVTGACGDAAFAGPRIEVLSFGLVPPAPGEASARRDELRAALRVLYTAGEAGVLSMSPTLGPPLAPLTGAYHPDRDDDPASHPATYTRHDLGLATTVRDPWGGPPLERTVHGFVAVPSAPPPPGGFPAVIALNGHGGSAYHLLDPSFRLWWGDGFARRGYLVAAVDMSHRPLGDREDLYGDALGGDDPENGNGVHPAVRTPGLDADWEEDGERAVDVLAVRAWLATRPDVDPTRVVLVGVSMGAEVATLAAALEPASFRGEVAAGFSPDLEIMMLHGNHPCWRLRHADLRDYVSVSDLHGLVPPGPFVVETGKKDGLFSSHAPPWSADKQVLRRSRAAFAGPPDRFVHFLHYDQHRLHFGDVNPTSPTAEQGLRVPVLVAPPGDWQHDGTTSVLATSLPAWLAE